MAATQADRPLPSEIVKSEDGTVVGYCWLLTETERAHIGTMLETDVKSITIKGNVMNQERMVCKGCGKASGLDDLVENALSQGIHNASFMLDVLQNGPKGASPPHEMTCSACGEKHEGIPWWAESVTPWHR